MPSTLRVAVTGAAGQIGYSLLPRIASGEMFGPDQKIRLQLLEIPPALDALRGVAMELQDCAFPLLEEVVITTDPDAAFANANWCLLVGSKPRGPGMERSDLLQENGRIFVGQGASIDARAADDCRIAVVGNPCNTNCMIAAAQGSRLGPERYTAMMRLDQNRATALLAQKALVDEVYERQSYSRAPDGIGMIMVLRKRRSPIRRATTTRSSAPPTAELVVEFRRRAGRLTRVSVNPVGGGTTRYVQTLSTSPVISKLEALAALLDEEPARVVAVVRGASLHSHLSARPRHPGLAAVTMSLRSSHAWSRCGRWLIGTPKDREGSDVPDP